MRRFDQRLIVKEAIAGGGNRRATEDLSRRFSHLRLSKVEVGVVRIGAVIHRVATLEDGSSGHALTEKPFEVRLGSDKVVLVGDVDPTLNIWMRVKP